MPGLAGTQTGRGPNAAGIVGIHNILDEGGYGDNVHDDAAVLTNLFNAAPSGGITVILPTATYNFGSVPSVPNNSTLIICAGVTINNNQPTAAAGGAILDWRNGFTVTGNLGATSIVSTSATALSVARAGTNYGLQVDESTANAATGLKITPAAAAGGLALAVISSGTNEALTLDAKGSGTVTVNGTATGGITLGRATTISTGGLTITAGGLTVTAGGLTVSAGSVSLPAGSIAGAALAAGAVTSDKASLSTGSAAISSDVTMTSANTFYDAASVSLVAGTWLIIGKVVVLTGSTATDYTAKLWDGTTVLDSAELGVTANLVGELTMMAIVSPGSTTTYKVSAAANQTGDTIKATPVNNGTGATNTASSIRALRIA
jgi:hypothetical protein